MFVPLQLALRVPRQRETPERSVRIYALVDPVDKRVRYVGKTTKPLPYRLAWHMKSPTNWRMAGWLAGLGETPPVIRALEYVTPAEWQAAERGWIAWFRARGQLLNIDPGGEHRDRNGRVRGVFTGTYQAPVATPKPVRAPKVAPVPGAPHLPKGGANSKYFLRTYKPVQRARFSSTRPAPKGAGGVRRYVTGDPGI